MDAITRDLQKPAPYTLLYADNVMLAKEDKVEPEQLKQAWNDRLAWFGLRLNLKKTEYMKTDTEELGSITVNDVDLPRTGAFKYLARQFHLMAALPTKSPHV
ncbi:hypothetical protein Y032_0069g367 [Ancylostoma ceylanicum]|uniref:Reverse transcriptase domain-containing protein n=1 Tax=Ancylostoma ceylanicum TaxID=53326 RepID=A0A016TY39_9BILA|nr:hypothetical protein Y032_0069g367 [Ancylostoma ceylanicum]